jgi:hypothetical protein
MAPPHTSQPASTHATEVQQSCNRVATELQQSSLCRMRLNLRRRMRTPFLSTCARMHLNLLHASACMHPHACMRRMHERCMRMRRRMSRMHACAACACACISDPACACTRRFRDACAACMHALHAHVHAGSEMHAHAHACMRCMRMRCMRMSKEGSELHAPHASQR